MCEQMNRIAKSVIGVRFLNGSNLDKLSEKTYHYLLDEKLTQKLLLWHKGSEVSILETNSFIITNDWGYNYRSSPVIIQEWKNYNKNLHTGFSFLDNIEKGGMKHVKSFVTPQYNYSENNNNNNNSNPLNAFFCCDNITSLYDSNSSLTCNCASTSFSTDTSINTGTGTGTSYSTNTSTNVDGNLFIDLSQLKDYQFFTPYTPPTVELVESSKNSQLNKNNRKEENKMFNRILNNLEFGSCDNEVKMSIYGPAFLSRDGGYVAFNSDEMIDVTGATFDFECMYKMPVSFADVDIGDYIWHNGRFVRVIEETDRNSMICMDMFNKEEVTVIPVTNIFGFNFFTKLVNLVDGIFEDNVVDEEHPFGSMLPFLMMNNSNNNDSSNAFMMYMMMNKDHADFTSNPFMLMALMNNNSNNNMLPMFLMMNHFPKARKKTVED